jgi:ribulose-phosphate 3-epimerase
MTVNPEFGGQNFLHSQLEKIRRIRNMIGGRPIRLEIDGGIDPEIARLVTAAGADTLVAGSAALKGGSHSYAAYIAAIRAAALAGSSQFVS